MEQEQFSPFFSIIVPTKNRLDLLKQCLISIFAQEFTNFEVIVVDDHSDDGTWAWLQTLGESRMSAVKNIAGGDSNGRNTGKKQAKGSYVCIIDDDDYVSKQYLLDFYQGLIQHQFQENIILRTHFVYDRNSIYTRSKASFDLKKHGSGVNFALFEFCSSCTLCMPNKMLEMEDFPAEVDNWQDGHFLLRFLDHGELIQLPSFNYFYRIHNKMGSKLILEKTVLTSNCLKHVGYMDDFFAQYGYRNPTVFSKISQNKLTSEKFAEYSVNAMSLKAYKQAFYLMNKSLQRGIFLRNWKHYGMFVKNFLRI